MKWERNNSALLIKYGRAPWPNGRYSMWAPPKASWMLSSAVRPGVGTGDGGGGFKLPRVSVLSDSLPK